MVLTVKAYAGRFIFQQGRLFVNNFSTSDACRFDLHFLFSTYFSNSFWSSPGKSQLYLFTMCNYVTSFVLGQFFYTIHNTSICITNVWCFHTSLKYRNAISSCIYSYQVDFCNCPFHFELYLYLQVSGCWGTVSIFQVVLVLTHAFKIYFI